MIFRLRHRQTGRVVRPPGFRGATRLLHFVPRMEVLEDRSLPNGMPSGIPFVTFDTGTSFQAVQSSSTYNVSDPQLPQIPNPSSTNVSITLSGGMTANQGIYAFESLTGPRPTAVQVTGTATFNLLPVVVTPSGGASAFEPHLIIGLWSVSLNNQNPASSYSILIRQSSDTAGTTLAFGISAQDASGKSTAGYEGLIHYQFSGLTPTVPMGDSVNSVPAQALTSDYQFTDLTGNGAGFQVSIPGSHSDSVQGGVTHPTLDQTMTESDGVVVIASYFFTGSPNTAGEAGLPFKGVLGNLEVGNISDGRGKTAGYSIAGPNSLVAADAGQAGPGFAFTIAVVQEIHQRSSSSAAQITWTGMRPPMEAPLRDVPTFGPLSSRFSEASLNGTGVPADAEPGKSASGLLQAHPGLLAIDPEARAEARPEARPMEKMVAAILRSLEQAKVDDLSRDVSQAALRGRINFDPDTVHPLQAALAFWPWDRPGPFVDDLAGSPAAINVAGPPEGDPDALFISKQASSRPRPIGQGKLEFGARSTKSANHPLPTSHWGWVRLLEGVAGLLLLGWPMATWLGLAPKNRERPRRLAKARRTPVVETT